MRRRLRGIAEINNYINDYVSEWGLSSQLDTDFAYDPVEDIVYWSVVVSEKNSEEFKEFFESLGCVVKADVFIYSLFHEIGHSQTLESVSEEDYNYSWDRKADPEITNYEYFRLPNEIVATQWAVDYINSNAEEIEEFWNGLQPLLMKFYNKNHIL